jgi:hypothetical protein
MLLRKIMPLATMVMLLSSFMAAQTLDEMLHPLLKKGHWDLSLDYKNFGHEYFGISTGSGPISQADSQVILFPRLAFGLARNLQLVVSGAYQIPVTFSEPYVYDWNYWRETKTIRTFSAQLQFRPAANLELSLFLLHGRVKKEIQTLTIPSPPGHSLENIADNILILRGTWLPVVDGESRPLRADFDGLDGPLLKKGRWRFEPEFLIREHEYELRGRNEVLPDYLDENSDSTDMRLRLAASYGLTDHLEVKAESYWQPSFRIRKYSRSLSSNWWDESEPYKESEKNHFYSDYWGSRGSLLWRLNPRMELDLTISRDQVSDGVKEDEAWLHSNIISQFDLGWTWLSKSKHPGITMAADLPGLYHPLLEKKQLRQDFRFCFHSYRNNHFANGYWDSDSLLFKIKGAYGISNSLQASAYCGIYIFQRLIFKSYSNPEKKLTWGMDIKWRPKKIAEIYAAFNSNPLAFLDNYPPFLLDIHSLFMVNENQNFLSTDYGESINFKLGFRLMF